VIKDVRDHVPGVRIYLYTSLYTNRMIEMLDVVDGVHYTIHAGATQTDIDGFYEFQIVHSMRPRKSCRLNIDARVDRIVPVIPNVWTRVNVSPWLTEEELFEVQPNGGLPAGESLYVLEGA
jgi:hypothetical protein